MSSIVDQPRLRLATRQWPSLPVLLALIWLGLLVLSYLLQFLLHDPYAFNMGTRLAAVGSPGHVLGTDHLGRDVLSRAVHGAPYSLAYGLIPVAVATVVGGTLGLVAGASGRIVNLLIMRVMDVLYAFPTLIVALAIVGALGPGFVNCLVALSVVLIPPVTRVAEAATVQVRSQPFVESATLTGASDLRVLFFQILPNALPPVIAYVTSVIGVMIIIGAGLSFLGFGVSTPTPEWGAMLNEMRATLFSNPTVAATPGVFIFLTSLSFSMLGEALERRFSLRRG